MNFETHKSVVELKTIAKPASAPGSRAIALKQCLGLPKPLWNELMEMLGGSLAEISKLERLKSTNDDFANN